MLPFTQQKEVDYAAVIEKHKGDKSGKKILMHVHASSHKEEGGGSPKSPSPKKAKPAKGAKGKIVDNPLSKADDNEVAPSATKKEKTKPAKAKQAASKIDAAPDQVFQNPVNDVSWGGGKQSLGL